MKRMTAYCSVFLMLAAQDAAAQRVRDMSMTPDQSFQQPQQQQQGYVPQAAYSHSYGAGQAQPGLAQVQAMGQAAAGQQGAGGWPPMMPGQRFMDGFCDPSFRPALAGNIQYAAIEGCLTQEKNNSCQLFRDVPPEVQAAVEEAISCAYTAGNNPEYQGDPAQIPNYNNMNMASCTANDSLRLQMLKKYWRDQNAAYALAFLPDQVLQAPASCARKAGAAGGYR